MEIYCLKNGNGEFLRPSLQATVLAKYSRSPESAKTVVSKLTDEEADKFHSKWTISYGHSSVAELATLPICFEGVSMVASKFIEKYQRAGYSEKSTRYQKFSRTSFVNPVADSNKTISNFVHRFYDAYEEMMPLAMKRAAELMGESNLELPKVKARAYDSLRYLLPAGTGTNLAAVMNIRDIRYLVAEARGHSNPEIQKIGEEVLKAASDVCPALLLGIEPDSFEPNIRGLSPISPHSVSRSGVKVTNFNPNGVNVVRDFVKNSYWMSYEDFDDLMNRRGNRRVPSVFKLVDISMEMIMDYGAYRDMQRHRRCEQYTEYLTPNYGYSIPDDFIGTELEEKYKNTMDQVLSYEDESVVNNFDIHQYVIPMGYKLRTMFKMDLAELYYIVELRTKPQGHISYRRIAYQMYEEANKIYPELMKWCRPVKPDSIGDHV